MGPTSEIPERPATSGLTRWQFFSIVCSFWLYATVSDVVYAYSMRTGIAHVTNMPLFASWNLRVLQHALLLPFLLVSFRASLRAQWRPLLTAVPLQTALGCLFAALGYPAMVVSRFVFEGSGSHGPHDFFDREDLSMWTASFVSFLPAYGFGLALVTGLALYTRFQKSELQVAALEKQWSAARLAALRMQLSPHTLFNLLHTIRGHIEWDPKGAQSMVVQLADLLRRLLNAGEREFTRLADELEFVRLYLELQQRRFADRLTVVFPARDEISSDWVPSLILQPLVENAVVHGLAGHQGSVVVRVSLETRSDALIVRIVNSIALDKIPGAEGIGLRNVRERLAVQFDRQAALVAGPQGAEWMSEIRVPRLHDSPNRA